MYKAEQCVVTFRLNWDKLVTCLIQAFICYQEGSAQVEATLSETDVPERLSYALADCPWAWAKEL